MKSTTALPCLEPLSGPDNGMTLHFQALARTDHTEHRQGAGLRHKPLRRYLDQLCCPCSTSNQATHDTQNRLCLRPGQPCRPAQRHRDQGLPRDHRGRPDQSPPRVIPQPRPADGRRPQRTLTTQATRTKTPRRPSARRRRSARRCAGRPRR